MDVMKFKLNHYMFQFEFWFEQRTFNNLIQQQIYFHKKPLNFHNTNSFILKKKFNNGGLLESSLKIQNFKIIQFLKF